MTYQTRRKLLQGGAAAAALGVVGAPKSVRAAEFIYKFGNTLPPSTGQRRGQEGCRAHSRGDQGAARDPGISEQSARRRYRHAESGAQRRARVLLAVGSRARQHRAGSRHQRHRLRFQGL